MKEIIVQKFGGTSVADTEKIMNVAKAVIRERNNGNDVVVVVSAMGHTTDILTKLAKEISPNPSSREMDMLLSTGEGVSIALLAMALQAQGCDAISMNAMQVGIITEKIHSKARIIDIKTEKLKKNLQEGKIIVEAEGAQVSVYTVAGAKVYEGSKSEIDAAAGVYVVVVDGVATKVIVK